MAGWWVPQLLLFLWQAQATGVPDRLELPAMPCFLLIHVVERVHRCPLGAYVGDIFGASVALPRPWFCPSRTPYIFTREPPQPPSGNTRDP